MQCSELRKQQASPLMSQAFKPCAWLANIDFIKRLIAMNHLLIVVMSETQGGKSTFVDLMRFKFEPAIQTILLQADPDESESMLLETLSPIFNVSFKPDTSTFDSFFEQLPVSKHPILVVIDDAERLTSSCLHQLTKAYKTHGFAKRFYLCLVADYALSPQLRHLEQSDFKHFIHTIEPGALTEAEARTYVLRYAQEQRNLSAVLAPERFKGFYAQTQGQIAAIHRQLNLLNASTPDKKRYNRIWKLAPSLMLSLAVFVGVVVSLKPAPPVSILTSIPLLDAPASLASYVAPWYAAAEVQPVQPPPLQKFADDLAQDDDEQLDQKLALVDKVVVIPDLQAKRPSDKKQASVQQGKSAVARTNSQRPGYTIQLSAAKSLRELRAFMKQYHVAEASVQIRQLWRGHERWYVLTMGGFPKLTQAQLAAEQLPKQLKQLKPWVRSDAQLEEVG